MKEWVELKIPPSRIHVGEYVKHSGNWSKVKDIARYDSGKLHIFLEGFSALAYETEPVPVLALIPKKRMSGRNAAREGDERLEDEAVG